MSPYKIFRGPDAVKVKTYTKVSFNVDEVLMKMYVVIFIGQFMVEF